MIDRPRPVAGAEAWRVLGVIRLKDTVKPGMPERFDELRSMGIRTVMITGDNPLTAAAIADEAGVDDFLAEATPEDKMALIKREQAGGNLVAMTGDGTNDAPALAQADVGVAMNTGTQAAKEAGNMVDLDSNPTKLIEIVEVGKQLLITRGSLTTFSIANDVAKYFAIIPAMFSGVLPALDRLNVMDLAQPELGDPLGGDLQRADHRRPRPAGAARRQVPRRGGDGGAAPQPARLRPRRRRRPVRRHQADRRPPHGAGGQVMHTFLRQLRPALVVLAVFTVVVRHRLPAARHRGRPGRLPRQGQRQPDRARRRGRRQRAARPDLHRPAVLPPAAVGRRCRRLRRRGQLGLEPRPAEPRPARRRCRSGSPPTAPRTAWPPTSAVPVDAVTASGSGLDPHITVANARLQAARVAAARGMQVADVERLIDEHTDGRTLGVLGEPGVNVVRAQPRPRRRRLTR